MNKRKSNAVVVSAFIFIAMALGMFALIEEVSAETEGSTAVPVANFTYEILTDDVPLTVRFTDTSTESPTSWEWGFGDGGTSTEKNPEHTYAEPGIYTVTLEVTNDKGTNNNSIDIGVYYTISFDSAGGSYVAPISQEVSSTITPPEDPEREGHTFDGWIPEIPTTMPAENITRTATWILNQYTITFDTDGGTVTNPISLNYSSAVTKPADPTREGYTFNGWIPEIPTTMPAENITITAKWTINQYTITLNSNGDSYVDAITQDFGSKITAPVNPTKTGYAFNKWDPAMPATMPAEDMTITAKWTIVQYTITFDTDGGTVTNPITLDFGSDVTKPADPTREGYTFSGWNPAVPINIPAENITITAKWTINQYTITLNSNGGSDVDAITQDFGSKITAPVNPTKTGYAFNKWDPAMPATMPAKNVTLTAKWTINQYTITFDSDGGTKINPISLDFGSTVTKPADPTREGYTFNGWVPELPDTIPAQDITIVAQWLMNYTIDFDSTGGSGVAAITQGSGSTVTPPENPTREGYIFSHWNPEVPDIMPEEDIILTAKWTFDSHSIIFDSAGGSDVAAITKGSGSTVTPPENPTREGYIFSHWDPEVPTTMPVGNVVITAKWTFDSHSIIFDSAGGSDVAAITQGSGSTVNPPENPTRERYIFSHWDPELPDTMPTEDVVLTAVWNVMLMPVADFESSVMSDVSLLTVQFTDTSTESPALWEWDFGDGKTSTDQNPMHTYADYGTYVVTLTVTNDVGSDTKTADIEIKSGTTTTGNNNAIIAVSVIAIIGVILIAAIMLFRKR